MPGRGQRASCSRIPPLHNLRHWVNPCPSLLIVELGHVSMFALKEWEKKWPHFLFLPLPGLYMKTWVYPPYTSLFFFFSPHWRQPSFIHSWEKYPKGCWRNQREGTAWQQGEPLNQPGTLSSYILLHKN